MLVMPITSYINSSEFYNIPVPLKVAVIREELVALTSDALHAVVLNQFIYWSERIRDYDQFVLEEQQRQSDTVLSLRHGWIYKRASDLIAETMLSISEGTMRRLIRKLVEQGWISERQNPDNKWDKVLQYRTNIFKIQRDLQQLGYALNGFKLLAATCQRPAATQAPLESITASNLQKADLNHQNEISNIQIDASKLQSADFSSEITTKITSETSSSVAADADADGNMIIDEEEISIKMVKIWNAVLADQVSTDVHATRRQRLEQILASVFDGDLQAWQAFCQQVATTPFLRGQGPSGWKARLDWCLSEDKAHRILEGQYALCWKPDGLLVTPKEQGDEDELLRQCQTALATETDNLVHSFKQQLLARNGPIIYQRWFQDLQVETMENQILLLSHSRPYSRQQCNQRFHLDLLKAAQQLWPQINKVHVGAPQPSSSLTDDKPHRKLYPINPKVRQQDNGHPTIEMPDSQSFNIKNKGHKHANY